MATKTEAASLPFGIEAVASDAIPEAPRKNDRDDERWQFVKDLLNGHPGVWFKVKTFDNSVGAGQKASIINGGKNKMFPADVFEARYTRDKDSNTSALYMQNRNFISG